MVKILMFENKATYSVLWVLVSRTLSEHDTVCQTPPALMAAMLICVLVHALIFCHVFCEICINCGQVIRLTHVLSD